MELGTNFDDDFFDDEQTIDQNDSGLSWIPRSCNPKWFLENYYDIVEDGNDDQAQQFLCENPTIDIRKYQANYHYSRGEYDKAIEIFQSLVKILPPVNLVSRRETFEGLSRSFIKLGRLDDALMAAEDMKLCCKSKAHFVNYSLLSASIHHLSRNFDEEAKNLYRAIDFYQLNPDLWRKLAFCYAGIDRIEDFHCSELDFDNFKAAACLVRAHLILKCVAGTVQSFAKARNKKLTNDLNTSLESIPEFFKIQAQTAMCRDVLNSDLREKRDFQDLGSSKTKGNEDSEQPEDDSSEWSTSKFDEKWFSWIHNIKLN